MHLGVTKSVAPFLFANLEVNFVVKVNGENFDVAGKSVNAFLLLAGYDTKRVAVELNGDILPKGEYENTYLHNGDTMEVVSFVGGG